MRRTIDFDYHRLANHLLGEHGDGLLRDQIHTAHGGNLVWYFTEIQTVWTKANLCLPRRHDIFQDFSHLFLQFGRLVLLRHCLIRHPSPIQHGLDRRRQRRHGDTCMTNSDTHLNHLQLCKPGIHHLVLPYHRRGQRHLEPPRGGRSKIAQRQSHIDPILHAKVSAPLEPRSHAVEDGLIPEVQAKQVVQHLTSLRCRQLSHVISQQR
mmetsp:Transcript_33419/g.86842  ORF Transcript_33419/g.86842 Transcript_33419/m.86842 type:complete len:208 (-) Transcript_33419:958-1581(-)